MHDRTIAFVTPADTPRWKRWLVLSPVARIVFFVAMFLLLGYSFAILLPDAKSNAVVIGSLAHIRTYLVTFTLPAVLAYVLLVRLVERRPVTELAWRRIFPDSLLGIVAGLLLFSVVVGVLYLSGCYHIIGTDPGAQWLPALLMTGLGAGIGEEVICRGVLFRIIEEGLGTWAALIVSALLFGAAHIANPGATLWSSCAIAIEAGLLFGLIYHVTRSLPLCMGVHAAWNFAQGTIYGIPVSGFKADGWLVSTRSGPDWLSGGVFGAEASVVALGLCSLCTLALLLVALKRGSIIQPSWRRPKTPA
jgi:membrane protease YdiL (CAAX protease family)